MRKKHFNTVAAATVLVLFSVPLWAHHGNAAFDSAKRVTVKGTVVSWLWANPHCVLTFDAKDDAGNAVRWSVEAGVLAGNTRGGWSRQTFKPGDEVTVTLSPAKNGQPVGRLEKVVLPSGQVLNSTIPPDSPTEAKP